MAEFWRGVSRVDPRQERPGRPSDKIYNNKLLDQEFLQVTNGRRRYGHVNENVHIFKSIQRTMRTQASSSPSAETADRGEISITWLKDENS